MRAAMKRTAHVVTFPMRIPSHQTAAVLDAARREHGGDAQCHDGGYGFGYLIAAIEALCCLEVPTQAKFNNMQEYVTAKLLVAWWVPHRRHRSALSS